MRAYLRFAYRPESACITICLDAPAWRMSCSEIVLWMNARSGSFYALSCMACQIVTHSVRVVVSTRLVSSKGAGKEIIVSIFAVQVGEDVNTAPVRVHMDTLPLQVRIFRKIHFSHPLSVMVHVNNISHWCSIERKLVLVRPHAVFVGIESILADFRAIFCTQDTMVLQSLIPAVKICLTLFPLSVSVAVTES